MSAALLSLKKWMDEQLAPGLAGVTVHLQGLGNEEIHGGGYAPKPFSTFMQWYFSGKTPLIYGFYLASNGQRIYSEGLREPWRAHSAGDTLTIDISVESKVKQKG